MPSIRAARFANAIAALQFFGTIGCVEVTATSPPIDVPREPHDAMWWKPSTGCPAGTLATDRTCIACDISRGTKECQAKCDDGNGPACTVLGSWFESGQSPKLPDAALAAQFYERACALRSQDGCVALADAKMEGRGTPRDEPAAVEILSQLCDQGHGPACRHEAVASIRGTGVRADPGHGMAMLTRACALRDVEACWLAKDPVVLQDIDQALRTAFRRYVECHKASSFSAEAGNADCMATDSPLH